MLESALQHFQEWSDGSTFFELIQYWNNVVALVVATEPCAYEVIFKKLRHPSSVDEITQRKYISEHWQKVSKVYQDVGLEKIQQTRQNLCSSAESLDPNRNVHSILRLTNHQFLSRIRGHLGGAIQLRLMAEMLRRAAETTFEIQLPEEDENQGMVSTNMKKELYGSDRIFDGDRRATTQYLREFGLDYGVKIRWYVEGDTEYAALDSFFGRFGSIVELINLGGNVAQKRGKGVAFRENLLNDLKTNIFSFISIDGDRSDYVHAVRKAAETDEICGMFFIATPDFEFQNFTLIELEEILWEIAIENGASNIARESFNSAISHAKSGKELFKAAKKAIPELHHFDKGGLWGEKLMDFAWSNPEVKMDETIQSNPRLVIEAIQAALQASIADYHLTRTLFRVDPSTGRPIKR